MSWTPHIKAGLDTVKKGGWNVEARVEDNEVKGAAYEDVIPGSMFRYVGAERWYFAYFKNSDGDYEAFQPLEIPLIPEQTYTVLAVDTSVPANRVNHVVIMAYVLCSEFAAWYRFNLPEFEKC